MTTEQTTTWGVIATPTKVGIFGTLYYAILAGVYVSLVAALPESFVLHINHTTPVTSPAVVVPALTLFAIAFVIARDAHGEPAMEAADGNA